MRRAAVQALRAARRSHTRRSLILRPHSSFSPTKGNGISFRTNFHYPVPPQPQTLLQSSLYFKSLTIAIVSSLVASGAWYAYREKPNGGAVIPISSSLSNPTPLLSTASPSATPYNPTQNAVSASTAAGETTAETRRKALVVDHDQFFMGDIQGDQPLSKEVDESGRLVMEMLDADQSTAKLRQKEQSFIVGRGQGVMRYDFTQLASNHPIEDDHVEQIIQVPPKVTPPAEGRDSSDWMFWGVFDGHSGWTTSAKLRQSLVTYVARELNTTYKAALADSVSKLPTPAAVDAAIKKGFLRLDYEIVHESVQKAAKSKNAAVEFLAPAYSGACALLSFYDSRSQLLRIACAGDSRAVLGRKGSSGKWTATPLSEDQTGGTPSEIARLRAEHPGEENVTRNGRILGQLEPSRAFGDAMYKWSRETAMYVKRNFLGRSPPPLLKTPPYVTAEPIVTTTKIEPKNGDFVVLATDGLWECLTNEEVVGLVGTWLETQERKTSSGGGLFGWFSKPSLPVENKATGPVEKTTAANGGQRPPIRQEQWQLQGSEERFVVEDKNAATHLIRNALGGKNRDMVSALLSLPSPYSRRYRDDLTVQVIFFGQGPASGEVVPNLEASAVPTAGKPKL